MNPPDERILKLIDILIFDKKVSNTNKFCQEIGMLKQTVSKIRNGTNHFTVAQIGVIAKTYNVNANWIFGISEEIFN